MIPLGTYSPLDSTLSALRSNTLFRHTPVMPVPLNVSPNAMSTCRCSTIAVAGLSPVTPLSHITPTSVPAMPNRLTVLLMLLAPVTQPMRVVTGVVTAAAARGAAVEVDAASGTAVGAVSRRVPNAMSANITGDSTGPTGELLVAGDPSPIAASTPL